MSKIDEIAAECLDKANGDWDKAARGVRRRVDASPELYRELTEGSLGRLIWDRIKRAAFRKRIKCVRYAKLSNSRRADMDLGKATLLDFPIPGGGRLGDATHAQIREGAAVYHDHAYRNGLKGLFLDKVGDKMEATPKKTVEAVLSNLALAALLNEAEKEVK
jgi:hypothetical protein